MFIAAQFTVAKCWKESQCPSINGWFKNLSYIYTMEYDIAKREKGLPVLLTAWIDPESIMLSEIRQAVKNKYHIMSRTY